MKKARVRIFGFVWLELWALAPGACVTVHDLLARARRRRAPWARGAHADRTVCRAVARAEEAGLVRLRLAARGGANRAVWERANLPEPVTVEWAVSRGASSFLSVLSVYVTLRRAGHLRLTADGFRRAPRPNAQGAT